MTTTEIILSLLVIILVIAYYKRGRTLRFCQLASGAKQTALLRSDSKWMQSKSVLGDVRFFLERMQDEADDENVRKIRKHFADQILFKISKLYNETTAYQIVNEPTQINKK